MRKSGPDSSRPVAGPEENIDVENSEDNRNVKTVVFGEDLEFDAWFSSPPYYTEEQQKKSPVPYLEKLYVCNKCFKYTSVASDMGNHLLGCTSSFKTPGKLIYCNNQFSIREIDGEAEKLYCQCLCMFGKLFVDTKSVFYAIEGFKFYVLLHHISAKQEQVVGFFSKEKLSWDENNLACIVIFPPYQGQGLGQLLIEFSYKLSQLEGKVGSPEKPLSDHGRKSYLAYWARQIGRSLPRTEKDSKISIESISKAAGIREDDVIDALQSMHAFIPPLANLTEIRNKWNSAPGRITDEISVSRSHINDWLSKRKINPDAPDLIDFRCIMIT
ncbi:acyl-CoA N-acyltransferase [Dipodascopsis uninucleata]